MIDVSGKQHRPTSASPSTAAAFDVEAYERNLKTFFGTMPCAFPTSTTRATNVAPAMPNWQL